MARLPSVGDDDGARRGILEQFLEISHDSDGSLKHIDSVSDFGAIGDGVQDDTEAIQAAFDHLTANGSLPQGLYFPPGSYAISATLRFPEKAVQNKTILGAGPSSVLKASTALRELIAFPETKTWRRCQIRGLQLDCNHLAEVGLRLPKFFWFLVENFIVLHHTDKAIWIGNEEANVHGFLGRNILIAANEKASDSMTPAPFGFYADRFAYDCHLQGIKVRGCSDTAIYLKGAGWYVDYAHVYPHPAPSLERGIVALGQNNHIRHSYIDHPWRSGITLGGPCNSAIGNFIQLRPDAKLGTEISYAIVLGDESGWSASASLSLIANNIIRSHSVAGESGHAFLEIVEDDGSSQIQGNVIPPAWDAVGSDRLNSLGSANGSRVLAGSGSPEGVVTGKIGDMYLRQDGGPGSTLWVKESGTGTTGWAAK